MSAQPAPLPPPDPEPLRKLVRQALQASSNPDPLALVDTLLPTLNRAEYDAAARYGLGRMLSEIARQLRKASMSKPDDDPANTSARWQQAGQAAKARPDIFAARIVVAVEDGEDRYAFLGDCTKPMLREAARLLRERADAAQLAAYAQATRYENLSRKLRGQALVSTLPLATVESILDQ